MSITQYAIEKNRVTIVALLLIVFGGLSAFKNLPQAEDPGFTIRTALVMTFFPGASPQRGRGQTDRYMHARSLAARDRASGRAAPAGDAP